MTNLWYGFTDKSRRLHFRFWRDLKRVFFCEGFNLVTCSLCLTSDPCPPLERIVTN